MLVSSVSPGIDDIWFVLWHFSSFSSCVSTLVPIGLHRQSEEVRYGPSSILSRSVHRNFLRCNILKTLYFKGVLVRSHPLTFHCVWKRGFVSVEMVTWKRDTSEMQRKRGLVKQSSQPHRSKGGVVVSAFGLLR